MDSCDEFTCPICLDSFKDPVTIDCGHNFCHACLTQYCRACGKDIPCPQCREIVQQRNFRPNRQLANVIETVKRLQKNKQGVCAKHQVPLNLFCKEDAALVCLVCDRTRQHKHHVVVPAEDVATEYKEKIKACLKSLEKSSEAFISRRMTEDLRSSQYLKQLEVEKQKISCAFEPIQNLLEERKSLLLDHVVNLEKEIKETRETDLARLSGKITHLGNLITEMERKLQQPANEFLQDIKGTLLRSEEKQEVCHTSDLTPFWEDRLILYSQKTSALERALKKCQDSIEYALDKAWCVNLAANKAEVTLDPDTSNAFLVLSNDQISVRCGEEEQDVPSNPGRFSLEPCVLGNNVFTSGHAWWEVHVIQGGEMWALGVAKDTVRRKGNFIPSPDQGIWAIGKPSSDSSPPYQLWAFTSPKPTPVSLKRNPRKIRVCLDYEEERVEFFDANTNHLIFAFPSASFSGQNLRPFFWVEPGACLRC